MEGCLSEGEMKIIEDKCEISGEDFKERLRKLTKEILKNRNLYEY